MCFSFNLLFVSLFSIFLLQFISHWRLCVLDEQENPPQCNKYYTDCTTNDAKMYLFCAHNVVMDIVLNCWRLLFHSFDLDAMLNFPDKKEKKNIKNQLHKFFCLEIKNREYTQMNLLYILSNY